MLLRGWVHKTLCLVSLERSHKHSDFSHNSVPGQFWQLNICICEKWTGQEQIAIRGKMEDWTVRAEGGEQRGEKKRHCGWSDGYWVQYSGRGWNKLSWGLFVSSLFIYLFDNVMICRAGPALNTQFSCLTLSSVGLEVPVTIPSMGDFVVVLFVFKIGFWAKSSSFIHLNLSCLLHFPILL